MSIRSINTIFSSRAKAMVLVATIIASFYAVVVPAGAANAIPRVKPAKVTICHRTHSTTNPYRMITVSKNSVDGPLNQPDGTGNAPGDHAGTQHNNLDSGNPNVFDPTFAYAPNAKTWQDIIPPFTVDGPPAKTYNGVNWTTQGKAIYFGTGSGYGLCRKMSAKEYYNSEVAAGVAPSDVLTDLTDQGAEEDAAENLSSPSTMRDLPPTPKGPMPPTTVPAATPGGQRQNFDGLTQAIAGLVWYDLNNNGLQDNGELPAEGVTVQLKDPDGNPYVTTPVLKRNKSTKLKGGTISLASNVFAAPVTAYSGTLSTDASGTFLFPSVPEGIWTVTFIAPDGYTFTYDAYFSADGATTPLVPAGGAGFTWAGLIPTGSTYSISNSSGLANTGLSSTGWIAGAIALQMIGLGVVLMWLRRRKG